MPPAANPNALLGLLLKNDPSVLHSLRRCATKTVTGDILTGLFSSPSAPTGNDIEPGVTVVKQGEAVARLIEIDGEPQA